MREWRWELKKVWHQKLKERGVRDLPRLRSGRIGKIGPTRKCYDMSVPAHVAEVRKFKWFSKQRAWKRRKKRPALAAGARQVAPGHGDLRITALQARIPRQEKIPSYTGHGEPRITAL
ncbi:MAG: hypothetical protein ACTSWN_06200 [Promethearchaeota archaeon]